MNLAIFTKNGKNTEHFWDLLKYHKNAKTIFLMYFEQQAAYQKKLKMTILSKLAIKGAGVGGPISIFTFSLFLIEENVSYQKLFSA